MRPIIAALIAISLTAVWPAVVAANPYAPALTVNNRVITEYDIEQRVALLDALGAPGDLQELALEQLVEDRLKVQAGQQFDIELDEGALEQGLEEFASSRNITTDQVLEILAAREIDRQTIDDFVEAGLVWRELVGGLFRERSLPSEENIDLAIQQRAMMPVEVFVIAEIALPFAERGQAETEAFADELYARLVAGASFEEAVRRFSRSASAEQDGRLEPIEAARMPPPLRSQIALLRPGQITRPFPIGGGLAILKLVSIGSRQPEPIDPEDQEARDQLSQELFVQRLTTFGDGYLQELKSDAIIRTR